ncbi:MAG TPA: D-alanine--D-alanine ligase [bacterium (Candidatus Stahlbacteria)]|nr:D-alanine--D-alanine ligase [Candidatus Stahlbacteria bacterium]
MHSRLRLGIIFGGRSAEYEISLLSALGIMEAIDKDKYEIIPIGITKEGKWLIPADPIKAIKAGKLEGEPIAILGETSGSILRLNTGKVERLDVVMPVLHGPYGEDGTVQGLLELIGVPYVGSGVCASSLGMDKVLMKKLLRSDGLPVVEYMQVKKRDWKDNREEVVKTIENRLGYPCFTKPARLGSSVGISKIHSHDELYAGVELAFKYDNKILVEKGIDGRELECSVLGNDNPIASCIGEVIPSREFYSYKAKYVDGKSKRIIPADIDEKQTKYIQSLAIRAFIAIDCKGMARVDFFMIPDQVYVNEINTIPGFTPISMYPKLWEASGISYSELIDRLIELALEK